MSPKWILGNLFYVIKHLGLFSLSIFNILFEVISAYGTADLSTGVPCDQYSLVRPFQALSKIILLFVMIRGRHNGLSLAIDKSILLPGEELVRRMDEEYNIKGFWG